MLGLQLIHFSKRGHCWQTFKMVYRISRNLIALCVKKLVVFGLGRIFRLERSAIFMTEFWARLELGAINFHLKPCMFTWAKIGSPIEVIILALYSNVASYHLISTRFLITTSFMISIKWPVDYPIYTCFNEPSHLPCPTSNIGLRTSKQCLPPCGG